MKTTKKSTYAVIAITFLTMLVTMYQPTSIHARSKNSHASQAATHHTADDTATLLQQLKPEKKDLLASSVEHMIELGFAIRHPEFMKFWL